MGVNNHRNGKDYLATYPRLRKWVQQCVLCQSEGYNPEMPDFLGVSGFGPANIRRMFPPLSLDSNGVCEQCREAQIKMSNC